MQSRPTLIIQPRRLGDLLLTAPLINDLRRNNPDSPLYVIAHPQFYKPLQPLFKNVAFFPAQKLPDLAHTEFSSIINLGSDKIFADFTAIAKTPKIIGQTRTNGALHAHGFWQLYRESLTHANRHNLFHWADLFRMDLGLPVSMQAGHVSAPAGTRRIGLFIGASQAEKRPDAIFWTRLAKYLLNNGMKPVIFGGPADAALAGEIMAQGAPAVNMCGKTSLVQLATLMQELDLFITPDTGPMHLANMVGTPVLNLSMGNVSAAETGPYSPGQHILRANFSCSGCWQCNRTGIPCRQAFSASYAGKIALQICQGQKPNPPTKLSLLTTTRDKDGFFALANDTATTRAHIDNFWKYGFLTLCDAKFKPDFLNSANSLCKTAPAIAAHMQKSIVNILARVTRKRPELDSDNFWATYPYHTRIFASFIQMSLQNASFSSEAYKNAITRLETIHAAFAENSA